MRHIESSFEKIDRSFTLHGPLASATFLALLRHYVRPIVALLLRNEFYFELHLCIDLKRMSKKTARVFITTNEFGVL